MNPEQIDQIAKRYALYKGFVGCENQLAKTQMRECLNWLLRDYLVVEKSMVMAIYNRKTIPTKDDVTNKFVEEALISALFPDTFNPTEK